MKNKISNPKKIKHADIMVGIPSYNESDSIGYVVAQVDAGLKKYFPGLKSVIINADNYSPDNTKNAFLKTKTINPKLYISTAPGVAGKGYNFFNILTLAKQFKAKAVAVVDADLKSITPEWVRELLRPILEDGYEYVTPRYSRFEYDGSITNHICFPLIQGLFGINLRQPIGGDFAFSSHYASELLKKKWYKTTYKYGVDIFMTMNAILDDYKIAEVALGAKIHKPSAPKLGPMFSQVLHTLFKLIKNQDSQWKKTKDRLPLKQYENFEMNEPQTMGIDIKGMKANSIFEYYANKEIIARALSKNTFQALDKMYKNKDIKITKDLWSKIVYEFLAKFITTDMNSGLIEALKPLYFGRFVSFYRETIDKDYVLSEKAIIRQAQTFKKQKQYFLEQIKK